MNVLLRVVSFFLDLGYVFVFFWMLHTFLGLHGGRLLRIAAFFICNYISTVVVYSNDFPNLFGAFLGIFAYIMVFHRAHLAKKLTAVLVFYPTLIAVNYLMQDIGSRCFFWVSGVPGSSPQEWTEGQWLANTALYALALLLRLCFWLASWRALGKYLRQPTSAITWNMWFVVDALTIAPFVAIFTIIYFMPENPLIVYPICGASIFSSFSCIYLISYICASVQTMYHAQELEMRQEYYTDRMRDEGRVRSIYHDLKNHLLLLQAQSGNGKELQESIQGLQDQVQAYENYYHTGNEFLDILIRDKARAAQERGIDFSAAVSFGEGAFIDPLDISTIFGNALDNAIEASEGLPKEQRLVMVKASRVRELLVAVVQNNVSPDASLREGTTKGDTFAHGFGLNNIRHAVQKYGGQCSVKIEDGMFALKIAIPIP